MAMQRLGDRHRYEAGAIEPGQARGGADQQLARTAETITLDHRLAVQVRQPFVQPEDLQLPPA